MDKILLKDIVEAVNGRVYGKGKNEIYDICTDSRLVKQGSLFVALKGERFDGHDYVEESFEKGAAAALVHKKAYAPSDGTLIQTEDTLLSLGRIAAWYRGKFQIPLIAITGSVGKTSTKEMIASVMSQKFNVLKTHGNYNNEIGLPLTLFCLEEKHTAAVLEMGMSGLGEIKRLSRIARPDIAVITNIGLSHIEKLGSRQNILRAKMEITEGLAPDGVLILNGDDELLSGVKGLIKHRTIFYGMEDHNDIQAYDIQSMGENGSTFSISIGQKEYLIRIPIPGLHNVYNALAAISVGLQLNVDMDAVIRGIASSSQEKMRLNIINHNNLKIINDAYNASPQSMRAGLSVLKEIAKDRRTIAVLGDMLEMGEWAKEAHLEVGKDVYHNRIDYLFTVGRNSKYISEGALASGMNPGCIFTLDTNEEAAEALENFVDPNDVVLIKGSRGMRMEKIANSLIK